MSIDQHKDIEEGVKMGHVDLEAPSIINQNEKKLLEAYNEDHDEANKKGSIKMVLFSTFVAVCGSFEFGTCVGYSAPTESAIRKDLHLSLAEYSMFGSILTIGAMIGAITSGRIADFIGRKWAMRISAAFCIAGWLFIYFSMGALALDIGRILTGYGIGVFSYVIPVFISEITPKNLRGGFTSISQLMVITGGSTAFVLGSIITWRALALFGLGPCIILLIGLCFVPESPRWLAQVGSEKEFQNSLRRLRGKDADISNEVAEIQNNVESLQDIPQASMLDLFQTKYLRSMIIGVGLMVFQQMGGINGIGFYASETFVAAGLSSAKIGTIALACVQVPITLIGVILIDKSGRRSLIMGSATGAFLGCFITGTSFLLKDHEILIDWAPILAISGVLIYVAAFAIGMGSVPWVIASEIFPLNVKGSAMSFVVLVNWLAAWVVSYTFNYLMSWSSSGTFYIYAGFSATSILFVAKLVPETKGKTLEEIQACINK